MIKNNINMAQIVFDADGAGGASGGKEKFSASVVNERIDKIIEYKNSIYDMLSKLTELIRQKVTNESDDEAALGGAIADIKSDWGNFQVSYNDFSTSMDNIKRALVQAGDSIDAFNKSLSAYQTQEAAAKASRGAATAVASAGSSAATSTTYGGGR